MSVLLKEKNHSVAHLITLLRSKPLTVVGRIHSLFLWEEKSYLKLEYAPGTVFSESFGDILVFSLEM